MEWRKINVEWRKIDKVRVHVSVRVRRRRAAHPLTGKSLEGAGDARRPGFDIPVHNALKTLQ